MIADLGETEWSLLARCCRAIGASCLDALGALLLSGDDNLAAERAGDVFVAIGEDAIQPLVRLLAESQTTVRPRVATLLGRIASPAAVPALQAMLRAHDSRVIQAAVRALAGIDDPAAARAIHLALRASDGRAREMVVDALVAVADRRVVPMLVRVLQSSRPLGGDYQVTRHALDALARLRDGRAVRAVAVVMFLRRSLLRRCFSRRTLRTLTRAAVRTLLEIGDAAALQALDRAGRIGDRMLRGIVREVHVRAVEGAA
jgi:HEAT repeat protein